MRSVAPGLRTYLVTKPGDEKIPEPITTPTMRPTAERGLILFEYCRLMAPPSTPMVPGENYAAAMTKSSERFF
eukprot:m.1001547 g.1001547  ORF g.1001547 m.1001547 type:complete len:73 (+) comp24031_c0_seq2:4234-4452(+)